MRTRLARPSTGTPVPLTGYQRTRQVRTVGFSQTNGGSSSASYSVTSPTPAVDDLIVVFAYQRAAVAGGTLTVSATGLTFTERAYSGDDYSGCGIWTAPSPDATARSITATASGTSGVALWACVLRGVDLSNPVSVTGTTGSTASSTTQTIPAVTTTTRGALAFAGIGSADDNSFIPTVDFDGWVFGRSVNFSTTLSGAVAWKEMAEPGTTGDCVLIEAGNGPDSCRYATVAFRAK